jgi:predicted ATPase
MARTGRQILLETHSEHIVNAMRAIIAENLGHPLSKEISIYFLDAKREGIEIHQLAMQPDGSLSDWPMSFFGEAFALSSRILKAQRNHIREAPKQS